MKWTEEVPSATGWYWHHAMNQQPEIVYVKLMTDGRMLGFPVMHETGKPVADLPGRWFGPLATPES